MTWFFSLCSFLFCLFTTPTTFISVKLSLTQLLLVSKKDRNWKQKWFDESILDLTNSNHVLQVSEKSLDLKKSRKVLHAQDSVKETRLLTNTSHTWNRPRCGVPDFPTQKGVHYQERHRQRRFVLYGGRLEKTDLTYRYNDELGRSSMNWLKCWLCNYSSYYFCQNAWSKYKLLINDNIHFLEL